MAIACGGTVFGTEGSDLKMEKASMSDLGEVEEVTITKDDTLMLRGKGDPRDVDERMEMIKDQIEDTKSEYEKEKVIVAGRGAVGVILIFMLKRQLNPRYDGYQGNEKLYMYIHLN